MNAHISTSWDGVERRSPNGCRRKFTDRRSNRERRNDLREDPTHKRSLKEWVRSLTHARLGVDRRKGFDQRMYDRRCDTFQPLLSQEELSELLR